MTEIELYSFFESKIDEYLNSFKTEDPNQASGFNMISPLMGDPKKDSFEVQLSSCIKYFLDPIENHNQGSEFLRIFLKSIGKMDKELCQEQPTVVLEKKMKGRRIDISLSWPKFQIGMEFKIWTKDSKNQIQNYLNYYQEKKTDFLLLYINPYGSVPENFTTEDSQVKGNLRVLSIEGWLIELVKKWSDYVLDKDQKVSFFLQEFLDFLQKKFQNKENEIKVEIKNIIAKYPKEVENLIQTNLGDIGGKKSEKIKIIEDIYESLVFTMRNRSEKSRRFLMGRELGQSISKRKNGKRRGTFQIKFDGFKINKTINSLTHVLEKVEVFKGDDDSSPPRKVTKHLPHTATTVELNMEIESLIKNLF
tara:strand:- start:244254 stop:245342 length:1089 start_codon:yes stop_codon:yes gene_type:complete